MAELKCGAKNCTYNEDNYCCKGDIMVGGKHAGKSADTCCESFVERKGDKANYISSISHPSKVISIDCEAEKCMYNKNYKCVAEHVDIKGCNACDSKETVCATFVEK
ncbi:MAG: DUF1540 domain-containing protein [Lachnospiraceae bacterium]|nr:DUF1540 domain-containing protein [Lachnospiraceae bacterium]